MAEGIDFTSCRLIPGRAYNGANGKKIAVEYNGTLYMLKFPPSGRNKPTELSYTNSCFSEHIASSIFNLLGVRAHETMLGTFKVGGKDKIVCACKDFTVDGKRFFDFCSIKNTILESDSNGTGTELEDILDTIGKQQYVSPDVLEKHFWDMFVADALLGNFDRHNGNWGFLFDEAAGEASLAPIYDCGSCLLPQADERVMNEVLTNEDALHARIYQYPTSAIKQSDRKINYRDFLMAAEYEGCNEAVKRIVPRVDMDAVDTFIGTAPYLSDLQRAFYKHYIRARYELILAPAFDLVTGLEQEPGQPTMGL